MTEQNETVTVPDEIKDSPHFANLRSKAEKLEADLAAERALSGGYRELLVRNAVELAGFKPGDDGTFAGVTGLLVKEFTASLTDEVLPTKDAFLALATSYNVSPDVAPVTPAAEPSVADQIIAMQQAGNGVRQGGSIPAPIDPGDLDAQIRAAQERGDVQTSLTLQMRKLKTNAA